MRHQYSTLLSPNVYFLEGDVLNAHTLRRAAVHSAVGLLALSPPEHLPHSDNDRASLLALGLGNVSEGFKLLFVIEQEVLIIHCFESTNASGT